MSERTTQRAAVLGIVLMGLACLALLVLEVYQAFWNAPELRRGRERVVQTFEVITTAQALERSIRDAERGQRVFLLTSDRSHLEEYRHAAREIPVLLGRLERMSPDHAAKLEHGVHARLSELTRVGTLIEAAGPEAALAALQGTLARPPSDAIDLPIRDLIDAEYQLLSERQRRAVEDERETALEALTATILGLVIVAIGALLMYHALAERARQHRALEQARAALAQAQKMEALGQLTGGVAHDFNNLLTVIMGSVETAQRRLRAGDTDVGRLIDAAHRGAQRAANLTRRLLAFARRQPLDPKPLDPNKLVAGVLEIAYRTLGDAIAVETVLGAGVWWIAADGNQLESALLNLVINARDAMPNGGKLTVETANAYLDHAYVASLDDVAAGQYVMIAVSDNGVGMTQDIVDKAFDPFFTTKEAGHGTGLGLSQVYGFIKQSGGHVKIYSEPGEGTTVKLFLPRLRSAESVLMTPATQAASERASRASILVVEDDTEVRAFATQTLAELGYRVLEAPDARAALELIEREECIDLLFTDVGLPNGVNGRQLAEEAVRRKPELKVLYTTGYARNAIIHHGRLDPGIDLVTKPFTQADLARTVRSVLDS